MQEFSAAAQSRVDVWETHTAAEFEHRDADLAISTMTDQASLLLQLDILDAKLPLLGADQANRLLDPDAPANRLIERLG